MEKVRTWPEALKVAEMRSITSTKISFFSPRPASRSAMGLCTARDDIVLGADFSVGRRICVELDTGAGSLKTKACSSAVAAHCG
eukprot:6175667-Pleurochrysis_carterae.AAC.3